MSIKVYMLNNSIEQYSVEKYLEDKAAFKENKRKLQKDSFEKNADRRSDEKPSPDAVQETDVNLQEDSDRKPVFKAQKNSKQQKNAKQGADVKRYKDRRYVFISDMASAPRALSVAGIVYEGEIDLNDIEFCKVEAQRKCLCGNLHIPKLNDVTGEKFRIYFFVNRKNIVIIDEEGFVKKVMSRIMSSRVKPGRSREIFLYNFCVKFMDYDLDNLGRYEKKIMRLEEDINENDLDGITDETAQLRRELLILREYYDELRDFGKQLEENENHFFSGKNLEYFGIISDRADRLMGRTMYLIDYIGQVRETYQGKVAEQQNANMQFLTIMSTIFFPLTLITGWYGMNFENMPELSTGYPFVIILSLLVIAIIILICKKKKIF